MLKKIVLPLSIAAALVCTTPLHAQKVSYAELMKNMAKCNVDAVKQLLGGGQIAGTPIVDPNALTSPEGTPIIVAASGTDCVEGVHQLLNAGSSEKDKDAQGNTPLHMAAASSTQQMVQLLVEKGADVNAKNAKGETPLALAQTNNYKGKTEQKDKIVAYLVKKGAK